jgi:hypothetical protein
MKRMLVCLLVSIPLGGCAVLGTGGWIAQHTVEIGEVALVAGAVALVTVTPPALYPVPETSPVAV